MDKGKKKSGMTKAAKLRALFGSGKVVRIMGAHNALGAKLIERAGFDGVWASGLEISTSFGVPDANILTMTDFLNAAESMNESVGIPVVADCDTGFGNSNNVIHMVRKYEAAGIAAVCIEDKHFPKVNSFIPGRQELASVSEFMGKILAAKNAQVDPDFMVIARVEALIAGWGMEEALRRACAYVEAGADAILIHSKSKTIEEISEFCRAWKDKAPLVAVPTTYYDVPIATFQKLGISMVIYANHGLRASIKAMQDTFRRIHENGSTAAVEGNIASMQEVFELQGMNKMKEDELIYSGSGTTRTVAILPAAGDHLEEYSMKDISSDIPLSMLDINGKPILQRQAEILNRARVYDIRVVAGYKKDRVQVGGVRVIPNDSYRTSGILDSVMCALKDVSGPALVIYGDILFDHILIERILNNHNDITLVLDNTFDASRQAHKKKAELALTDSGAVRSPRTLNHDTLHRVKKIGDGVKKTSAQCEFTGIMYLSAEGVRVFKDNYRKKASGQSLVDFIDSLILKKHDVSCLVVNSGWLEIHSLEDYKAACSLFK
ncbi:MAG TPA: phosphoenolpyruvate mutase [Candidatus Omnitrophota bacterium]|nr:phosphoenolpyruvate mutase [Candidatus Omnitrophota bacterium]HQJ15551.1 phosphoenolpyruvate mutase [Candidatus Omnitrophota bacterium]